jgi:hypothetical protein
LAGADRLEVEATTQKHKKQQASLASSLKVNCCSTQISKAVIDLRMAEVYQASTTAPVNIAVVK